MVRREGFEPPAFWSVGCLKAKSESFRLRFVLFTTIRSADFSVVSVQPCPLFSDSGSKLGQDMRKPETYRNEIKSYIVRTGMTMTEVVDYLSDEYGWSRSVPNLSGKLKRGSLRYGEAVELADALGYDIVWEKR